MSVCGYICGMFTVYNNFYDVIFSVEISFYKRSLRCMAKDRVKNESMENVCTRVFGKKFSTKEICDGYFLIK